MLTKDPKKKTCPHCGAAMMEYRHTFNRPLVEGLLRIYTEGVPINLKLLGLTRNQWDNFQKLRYWDLVEKHVNAKGQRVGGTWRITQRGIDFVEGKSTIYRHVFTYRGIRVRYEGDIINFSTANHPGYQTRPEYVETSVPTDSCRNRTGKEGRVF